MIGFISWKCLERCVRPGEIAQVMSIKLRRKLVKNMIARDFMKRGVTALFVSEWVIRV